MTALPAACDLLVVGSGAGGLAAAVSAAALGLQVVVVEKESCFGGTTAWSGGWMWIPRNPLAVAAGIVEDVAEPRRYLQHLLGAQFDAARVDAFLQHGPSMLRWFMDHTPLRFVDGNAIPDFHGRAPGARTGGRSVCAAPFDAGMLGPLIAQLRPPHPLMQVLGISIGGDLRHFLRAPRAADSAWYVARRVARQLRDLALHGHGRLRMGGNALAAALLASAQQRGVGLFASQGVQRLLLAGDRVTGAVIHTAAGEHRIAARRGVVLACGGFPHDARRQGPLFGHAPHWSAAPLGNTGDGLTLGEGVGALLKTDLADAGAWAPCSRVPMPGGGDISFPHLVERGKPGLIAVDGDGRRFVSEAGNYHSLMRALFARCAGQPVQAWLVCDDRFLRRWGLGAVKPWPFPRSGWQRKGYLVSAATPRALAEQAGFSADGFEATLARYNPAAREGHDPEFDRGGIPYERMQGDAEHGGPNPCVAPIEHGPFHAVRIVPGSLGTFAGLAVDAHARVLRAPGEALPGLYAAGNDMASVMGGHYPSGGITLGPAMTFGWVLAHHAAGQPLPMPEPAEVLVPLGALPATLTP